jgi:hypothetical protein
VVIGAVVAGAIAIAAGLALRAVPEDSNAAFLVLAVIMVGMAIGGFVAARDQADLAFTAGAVAAFGGSLVAQTLSALVRVGQGTALTAAYLVGAVFTLLISTSFGIIGGYVALRRDRTLHADADPDSEDAPT